MANPFAYCELHTQNPGQAKDFYGRLFDWKMSDSPSPVGTYTEIAPGEGIAAGLLASQAPGAPSHWLTYIRVEDVEAATQKARTLGANVLVEAAEVPNTGWFSVLVDPTGAHFGIWEKMGEK